MMAASTNYRDNPHEDDGNFGSLNASVGGRSDNGVIAMQSPELELAFTNGNREARRSRIKFAAALCTLLAVTALGGWRYHSRENGPGALDGELAVKKVIASQSKSTSASIRGADNNNDDDNVVDEEDSNMMYMPMPSSENDDGDDKEENLADIPSSDHEEDAGEEDIGMIHEPSSEDNKDIGEERSQPDMPSESESERFRPGDNSGYLSWLKEHGDDYDRSIFQPAPAGGNAGDGVAIHWAIDESTSSDSRILLAVAARAEGWVGFGLAEAGGMRGADMVLYEAEGERLIDAHVLSEPLPLEDECQSWKLRRSHKTEDGFLIFEAVRLLDTGDPQDRAIPTTDFPQRVLAAWGDSKKVTHHEPGKKVRSIIRFRSESDVLSGAEAELEALAATEADIIVDLVAGDYAIPSRETYKYAEFCFTEEQVQTLLRQKMEEDDIDLEKIDNLHLLALEPILDNEEYVHHISIAGSQTDRTWERLCNVYVPGAEMIYIWDVGADPMILPKEAGIPFGKTAGGHMSLSMEIHYNNPSQTSGLVDNSGFRLYFTSKKRQHDLGMMQVGDPTIGLMKKPVGEGLTKHTFDCPETCTRGHLKEEIVVVQEGLHMHKTGARMVNRQLRNGKELRSSSIEYNDFYMAGQYVPPQEPFVVKPSDTFETECYYDADATTVFGRSTTDEMCITFMWYYPKSAVTQPSTFNCGVPRGRGRKGGHRKSGDLGTCDVNYTKEHLADRSGFERTFGFRAEGDAMCKQVDTAN